MLSNALLFMYGLIQHSHNPMDNFTHMSTSFNYELFTCFTLKGGMGSNSAARFPSDC